MFFRNKASLYNHLDPGHQGYSHNIYPGDLTDSLGPFGLGLGLDNCLDLPCDSEEDVVAEVLGFAPICAPLGCDLRGGGQEGALCQKLGQTNL